MMFLILFCSVSGTDECLLTNYNSNHIILIPKEPGANVNENIRAIALANFKYKIISKILTDRLALVIREPHLSLAKRSRSRKKYH